MKMLLPIVLFVIGSSVGVGAGMFLQPDIEEQTDQSQQVSTGKVEDKELPAEEAKGSADDEPKTGYEYIKLTNQFVIPIVSGDRISSMVVAGLSLEVALGYGQEVIDIEPKLRNDFLRVMFDHANVGGFTGNFTEISNLTKLQQALTEAAQKAVGQDIISEVLIFEIARQDY